MNYPVRKSQTQIAFEKGYYAFQRGWLNNQHSPESTYGKEWSRGFNRGYHDCLDQLLAKKK
jgi:hypothetical protein